ncbi:serine hydrolase domain-containing protein [Variovorax sp. LT1R16]|uniref:serine hydrolase domain-containing protein n=1 Tax=Variovorax sp. LT1R16 TaxID=3443728 RepID=UPI003F48424D
MRSRRGFLLEASAFAVGVRGIDVQAAEGEGVARTPYEWNEAAPEANGFAPGALERVVDSGTGVAALRSLLVVRAGALVAERYYGGATSEDLLAINSMTKSVTSLLVGAAIAEGKLRSDLSQNVAELLPELAASVSGTAARDISLRQILTGTSGLAYDYRSQARALTSAADPAIYALELSADGKVPGSWSYNDAAISLLSPILQRAQGMSLAALVKRDLFDPLGIGRFQWERDKTGREYAYRGIRLRTRDLAKLAWTVANKGKWRDKQVVPAAWIEESTRPHTPGSWRVQPIGQSQYGYLWFTGQLHGKPVAWGWGYGGQFALVAPSLDLAVVTAATDPRPQDLQSQTAAIMALVAQVVALAV